VRLAIISIVVGVVLSVFGITPRNFFARLDELARWIYDLGFGAVEWLLDYMVLGAMIVVPMWLLARLLRWPGDTRE
jgi:8-oxo-dGTP pyrophosphatase MutT (NUDIX family)